MLLQKITVEEANDDEKLKEIAVTKFGFDESTLLVSSWTMHGADEVPKHDKDRLVVFKAPDNGDKFGCIRVRTEKDITKTEWDKVEAEGPYIGKVPAGCPFEAVFVLEKTVTPT